MNKSYIPPITNNTMRKIISILALTLATSVFAQQEIRLYDGIAPGSEGVQDNERISRGPDGSRCR